LLDYYKIKINIIDSRSRDHDKAISPIISVIYSRNVDLKYNCIIKFCQEYNIFLAISLLCRVSNISHRFYLDTIEHLPDV